MGRQFGPADARSAVAFRTRVLRELPSGGPLKPGFTYDLRLDSAAPRTYRVALSQEIAPGQPDHILLRVASDRSARYRLSIELLAMKQSLGRERLAFEIFIPRSAAGGANPTGAASRT